MAMLPSFDRRTWHDTVGGSDVSRRLLASLNA